MGAKKVIGCGCFTVIAVVVVSFIFVFKLMFGGTHYGLHGSWESPYGEDEVASISFDETNGKCSMIALRKSGWQTKEDKYSGKFTVEESTLFHVKGTDFEQKFVIYRLKKGFRLVTQFFSLDFSVPAPKDLDELDGEWKSDSETNFVLKIDKANQQFSLRFSDGEAMTGSYTTKNCLLAYCNFNSFDIPSNSPIGNSQVVDTDLPMLVDFIDKNTFKSFKTVFRRTR